MGTAARLKGGGQPCVVEGCRRFARPKTTSGLCQACIGKRAYHKKHPDAPVLPMGYHGKWKNKICGHRGCYEPISCDGLCAAHYGAKRWETGRSRPSAEQRRNSRLKGRYGITQKDFDGIMQMQNGVCAVCGEPPSKHNTRAHWNNKLCVDHDHTTNRVRGLLCNDCNLAVGYTKTAATAEKVARYFRIHDRPHNKHSS